VTEGFYAMAVAPMPDRETANPAMLGWMDRYRERFGEDPNIGSIYGRQGVFITAEALRRAGPEVSPATLVASLESLTDFEEPVSGLVVSFSATRHQGSRTAVLAQVEGGRWVDRTGPISY